VTAEGLDESLEFLVQGFGLSGGNILTRDKHVLVVRHDVLLPFLKGGVSAGPEGAAESMVLFPRWPASRRSGTFREETDLASIRGGS
jgi:hypothetical protein